MEHLVGQDGEVAHAFQVPDGGVDVDRLDRIAAGAVDDVVHLGEPQEIAVVVLIARSPAPVDIRCVWSRGHHRDDEIVAAEDDIVVRVASVQRELRRRVADQLQDHVRVEAHAFGALQHVGPVCLHDGAGFLMQNLDADLLQDPKGSEVDRFQLVVREDLGWREGKPQLAERRLLERRTAAGPFSGSAAASCPVRAGGLAGQRLVSHSQPRNYISSAHIGPSSSASLTMRRPQARKKRHAKVRLA